MKSICKKFAGAALVLLLVCVMTGCPHDPSDTPPAQQTPPAQPTPPAQQTPPAQPTPPADPTPPTEPPVPAGFVKINGGTVTADIGETGGPFASAGTTPVTVNTFYMAETELTYAKWYEVYTWATSNERGTAKYTFANKGREGSDGTDGAAPTAGNTEPVTCVSWRDAVVWCNAASEKDGLTPVYWLEGTTQFTDTTKVLRFAEDYDDWGTADNGTSVERGEGQAEKAVINESANGYRLPTDPEWEYAARGGTPTAVAWNYTYAGTDDESELGGYAVYDTDSTANVRSKEKNTAGLYDMSGNVWEWCQLTYSSGDRVIRGGCWFNEAYLCGVAIRNIENPFRQYDCFGFRVVCNAN